MVENVKIRKESKSHPKRKMQEHHMNEREDEILKLIFIHNKNRAQINMATMHEGKMYKVKNKWLSP